MILLANLSVSNDTKANINTHDMTRIIVIFVIQLFRLATLRY